MTFVDYGSESDTGFRGEVGYPIPDIARTQPNFIEGGAPGGGSSGDRHMLIVDRDKWVLFELFATRWNPGLQRWEAGSGAVFDLVFERETPRRMDVGRRGGVGDSPGSGPLRRSDEGSRPTRIPRDCAAYERICVARVSPGREQRGRAAHGRAASIEEFKESVGLSRLHPEHFPGDADPRSDRGRQRE